jgi:PAS domain S-box-containing protein
VSEPLSDGLLGPLLEKAAVGIAVLDADGRFVYVNDRLAEINGVPREEHLGRTIPEVIPHVADVVSGLHAQVMRDRTAVLDVQIAGSTPGAPDRIWQVSYLPIEVEGAPAVGVVLIDVTEREQAVAGTERLVRQHAAAADFGHRALAGEQIRGLMTAACELLTAELHAQMAGVLELARGRDTMLLTAGAGWPDGMVGKATADFGRMSQAGFTLEHGGPVISPDLAREARFEPSRGMLSVGAASSISTPIPGGSVAFGVLGVFSRDTEHFDEDDAGFVRAIANVLGTAVMRDAQERTLESLSGQRGRLVAQALDAGEREQRQVADVLHDDVLQHLLFARQELADIAGGGEAVERARASVEEAAALLRRVVAGLHPVTLAHAGLAAALESLARDHEARTGLRTDVRVDPRAEDVHDRLVISVVRELLTNVAKHAHASRAEVVVTVTDDILELTVADDGRGMPEGALSSALGRGNIGLATVRERVEALGGTAQAGTGLDGVGTCVEIRLPI